MHYFNTLNLGESWIVLRLWCSNSVYPQNYYLHSKQESRSGSFRSVMVLGILTITFQSNHGRSLLSIVHSMNIFQFVHNTKTLIDMFEHDLIDYTIVDTVKSLQSWSQDVEYQDLDSFTKVSWRSFPRMFLLPSQNDCPLWLSCFFKVVLSRLYRDFLDTNFI